MLPSLAELHFLNPLWLWAFILLPTLWLLYALFYKGAASTQKLKAFADEHLLPHLLKENPKHIRKSWPAITMWSLAWALTIIAMAGPRWNYRDVETFESDANMIVLLDLSKSMDAADVKPSRVALARQEIQDLIDKNRDVKIGLVAFAATPHMINPVTDDMDTITHLLPSLETELVTVQGSRLMPAFQMAAESLNAIPGTNKSLLVISDGDFDEHNMKDLIDKTLPKDVRVHTMGVGTEIGAPVPSGKGGFHKERGKVVITHLEAQKLKALAQAGNGQYFQAGPLQENASKILKTMKMKEGEKSTERTHRIWEEKFYLFLIPVLFLILPWFRRKYAFPVILMLTLNAQNAAAFSLQSVIPDGLAQWFQNKEQQGKAAFEAQDYEKAA
ncbi:MAG: VWA domain-containing protein, partial [Alphaproteobacteria bacterium]|nr:VWA domain-containing protein [Alphaproteobacteria bacterium]